MNVVKEIERLNAAELASGTGKSWHDVYKDSAYIFIGNLDHRLTEGDVRTVFSQFGEPTDLNLVRDKDTGKSKGFCFLAYEDQRSTVLAVDNFNGAKLMDRTLRVDHAKDYEPPEVRKMRQQERDRQKGKEVQDDGEERLNAKELLMKQLRGEAPAPKRGILPDDPADDAAALSKEEKKRLKKAKKEKKRAKKEKKRAKKAKKRAHAHAELGQSGAGSSSDSDNDGDSDGDGDGGDADRAANSVPRRELEVDSASGIARRDSGHRGSRDYHERDRVRSRERSHEHDRRAREHDRGAREHDRGRERSHDYDRRDRDRRSSRERPSSSYDDRDRERPSYADRSRERSSYDRRHSERERSPLRRGEAPPRRHDERPRDDSGRGGR